jgi:hypothetical protein
MNRGDNLFLHPDGVYDDRDKLDRLRIERVIREHRLETV